MGFIVFITNRDIFCGTFFLLQICTLLKTWAYLVQFAVLKNELIIMMYNCYGNKSVGWC